MAYLAPRVHKRQLLELSIKNDLSVFFLEAICTWYTPYVSPASPRHRYHMTPSDSADPLTWSVESIIHMSSTLVPPIRFRPCMSVSMLRMVRVNVLNHCQGLFDNKQIPFNHFCSVLNIFNLLQLFLTIVCHLLPLCCLFREHCCFLGQICFLLGESGGVHMEDSCARSKIGIQRRSN